MEQARVPSETTPIINPHLTNTKIIPKMIKHLLKIKIKKKKRKTISPQKSKNPSKESLINSPNLEKKEFRKIHRPPLNPLRNLIIK
jgi:hypothetical protein